MRFLFSFTGGSGHYLPTTVFARVLERRGHNILYACQDSMLATVIAAGWQAESSGGASLLDPTERRPLGPVDRAAEQRVVREFFAGRVARERAHRIAGLVKHWKPDLVVRDEMDFGAAIAAEAAGVPHAAIVVIAAGGFTARETIAAPLATLRSELGLAPELPTEALHRYLLLAPIPPAFRDPLDPLPKTARHIRPAILEELPAEPPAPAMRSAQPRPHVYFTLGTIFPQESGDLFRRVLAGLTRLPVEVTVTIGDAIAPEELGEQPSSVHIERLEPLRESLTQSDLVVSHGGSGTVVAALACGIPQVLLPMGADQPNNADRCERLGVGTALDCVTATPADVADAVATVLGAPSFRLNAERVAAAARALPDAEHAASLLESIAETGALRS